MKAGTASEDLFWVQIIVSSCCSSAQEFKKWSCFIFNSRSASYRIYHNCISSFRSVRRCTMWLGRWRWMAERHSCIVPSMAWSLVPNWWSWTTRCTCSPRYVPTTTVNPGNTSWVTSAHFQALFFCLWSTQFVICQLGFTVINVWSKKFRKLFKKKKKVPKYPGNHQQTAYFVWLNLSKTPKIFHSVSHTQTQQ